jgi:hypothetical protein
VAGPVTVGGSMTMVGSVTTAAPVVTTAATAGPVVTTAGLVGPVVANSNSAQVTVTAGSATVTFYVMPGAEPSSAPVGRCSATRDGRTVGLSSS